MTEAMKYPVDPQDAFLLRARIKELLVAGNSAEFRSSPEKSVALSTPRWRETPFRILVRDNDHRDDIDGNQRYPYHMIVVLFKEDRYYMRTSRGEKIRNRKGVLVAGEEVSLQPQNIRHNGRQTPPDITEYMDYVTRLDPVNRHDRYGRTQEEIVQEAETKKEFATHTDRLLSLAEFNKTTGIPIFNVGEQGVHHILDEGGSVIIRKQTGGRWGMGQETVLMHYPGHTKEGYLSYRVRPTDKRLSVTLFQEQHQFPENPVQPAEATKLITLLSSLS